MSIGKLYLDVALILLVFYELDNPQRGSLRAQTSSARTNQQRANIA